METSIGQKVVNSDQFRMFLESKARRSGQIPMGSFPRKSILTTSASPVPPDFRPDLIKPIPQSLLQLRDLIPGANTKSNLVEFPAELAYTGTVDYQTTEGTSKATSDITYVLKQFPVATIATMVSASKQVMDDSEALAGYIDARLIFKVEEKIEKEILFGDGATGHLTGLTKNANAGAAGTTSLDKIAASIGALATAGVIVDGIVLNPTDWVTIITTKNANGVYILGEPTEIIRPFYLWGFPVALTSGMTAGNYLVGGFQQYAMIFDRQAAAVEIATNYTDYFVKNMLAILAEARLALAIGRDTAFTYGAL